MPAGEIKMFLLDSFFELISPPYFQGKEILISLPRM